MISKKLESAINKQINHELNNAYAYLASEAWLEQNNWKGFAKWFHVQYEEEMVHARKFFEFLHDRGGAVVLDTIAKPSLGCKAPRDCFAKAVALEQATTKAINDLYEAAVRENDYALQSHLKWFIDEQVEEEKTTTEALALLDMAGASMGSQLVLDHRFGKRGEKE